MKIHIKRHLEAQAFLYIERALQSLDDFEEFHDDFDERSFIIDIALAMFMYSEAKLT